MRLFPAAVFGVLVGTAALAQPYGPGPEQAPPMEQQGPGDQGGPGPGYPPPGPGYGQPPGPGYGQPPGPEQGPGASQAPSPRPHPHGHSFEMANVTHDGKLTREQAQTGGMVHVAQHFDDIDTDHKGYITRQDLKTWRAARRRARMEQRQQQQQQQQQPSQQQPLQQQ